LVSTKLKIIWLSNISKSPVGTPFTDLDIDSKNSDFLVSLTKIFDLVIVLIETRGFDFTKNSIILQNKLTSQQQKPSTISLSRLLSKKRLEMVKW